EFVGETLDVDVSRPITQEEGEYQQHERDQPDERQDQPQAERAREDTLVPGKLELHLTGTRLKHCDQVPPYGLPMAARPAQVDTRAPGRSGSDAGGRDPLRSSGAAS